MRRRSGPGRGPGTEQDRPDPRRGGWERLQPSLQQTLSGSHLFQTPETWPPLLPKARGNAGFSLDFHTASTPSEISFPACGGSSRSTLKEYPSTPTKKPTAWDTRHTLPPPDARPFGMAP
ncbi:hypothetical protein R6Z07F_011212 [Ovis aries]